MSNIINDMKNYDSNTYKVKYTVTEDKYEHNGKARTAFGIDAFLYENGVLNNTPCVSIRDITSSKEDITSLVDTCNRLDVSQEHIYDVIEDFLM